LERRLPRIVWSHDWAEPLGRYIDYDDTNTHLDLIGEFDNFDDVPRARQAYAQLKSGTIDEFSVGFMPEDGEPVLEGGAEHFRFTRARLDEVSLVLAGAVPDTKLLAVRNRIQVVRSPQATIPKDLAAQIILDMHQGTIDLADALQQVKHPPEQEPEAEEPEAEEPEAEEVEDLDLANAEIVDLTDDETTEEPAVEEEAAVAEPVEEPVAEEVDLGVLSDVDALLLTHDILV
jgi:HK97 family phage prohead protease